MFPKAPFRSNKTTPLPFERGFLGDLLPPSYMSRLTPFAQEVANQITVIPRGTEDGAFYHVPPYGIGPYGHITASRNSPPLLFHEFAHALENLPSDYMSQGMFQDSLGPTMWPLLGSEVRARAERRYQPASAWGPWEYYPVVGSLYNYDPAAMPSEIRPYYSPWFRSSPDPRYLGYQEYPKTRYPTPWTGGP